MQATSISRLARSGSRSTLLALAALCALALSACSTPNPDEVGLGDSGDATQDEAALRSCVRDGSVSGLDVSVYQGNIDFRATRRSGRSFVMVRVSDGTRYPDSKFSANYANAKSAGLVRGAYQFFRPGQDPIAQADLLLSKLGYTLGAGDLPPVLDVEVTDGQSATHVLLAVQAWVDHVSKALGRMPFVYTSPGFWAGLSGHKNYGANLWVANWTSKCPSMPNGWSTFTLWQHSSEGRVPGVSGKVDLDKFNGSLSELYSLARTSAPAAPLRGDDSSLRSDLFDAGSEVGFIADEGAPSGGGVAGDQGSWLGHPQK
jgi:lysozyme